MGIRTHFSDPEDGKPMCRLGTAYHTTAHPSGVTCLNCKTKMEKHFKPIGEAFVAMLSDWLKEQGAIDGNFYELRIETKAGVLDVSPHPTNIHCRFRDVARAKERLGSKLGWSHSRLNPYSGKWNWNFELGAGATEFGDFMRSLKPLLLKEGT